MLSQRITERQDMSSSDSTNRLYASPYFTVHTVAEGVYALISTPGTGTLGNAGIVDLGDAALVFDTFLTLQAARDLMAATERLVGKPVKYVVNSHYNADHVNGNQVFADAVVISTPGTRELIATRGFDNLAEMRAHPEYVQELATELAETQDERRRKSLEIDLGDTRMFEACLPELELRLPSVLFDRRLVIWGSARHVELQTLGGGHTDSDAFMLVPDAKVAFLGDLHFNEAHPSLWTASPDGWITILGRIEQMDLTTVVPGHGPMGPLATVSVLKRYWEEMRAQADSLMQSGASADDIARTAVPPRYADWLWAEGYTQTLQKLTQR
jgi:glyoxylase-like metal-dependent hydrolase (beta-lactamase superfamily II)